MYVVKNKTKKNDQGLKKISNLSPSISMPPRNETKGFSVSNNPEQLNNVTALQAQTSVKRKSELSTNEFN